MRGILLDAFYEDAGELLQYISLNDRAALGNVCVYRVGVSPVEVG